MSTSRKRKGEEAVVKKLFRSNEHLKDADFITVAKPMYDPLNATLEIKKTQAPHKETHHTSQYH